MRVPHVISKNAIKAYEVPPVFILNEKIRSDDFTWVEGPIERLRVLCLLAIAKYWERLPLYEEITVPKDKSEILEVLPTKLPLELTVPIIQDEYYWERCYEDYWPDSAPPNRRYKYERLVPFVPYEEIPSTEDLECIETIDAQSLEIVKSSGSMEEESVLDKYFVEKETRNSSTTVNEESMHDMPNNIIIMKSWKQCFLERYLAEMLERMTPDIFHEEYIQRQTSLHKDYIISLKLSQLKSCKNEKNVDHISLLTVLSDLPNLIEFSVCFNQGNLEDKFSWHHLEMSEADSHNLGKGVKKSNLEILRILHSSLDCRKVKLLMRQLEVHPTLRTLDFSHCKIADDGALAIAAVLMKNPTIDTLILTNNKIGEKGAQGLGFYLCQPESQLLKLNLKLNPLGVQGGRYIATGLARGAKTLNHLSLAACGLTEENFPFGMALGLNNSLQTLDLSNNKIGESSGKILLERLQNNTSLMRLDLRLCYIPPEIVIEINKIIQANLHRWRGAPLKTAPYTEDII